MESCCTGRNSRVSQNVRKWQISENFICLETKIKKRKKIIQWNHPDERPRWWETTWWETATMRDCHDERLPRWMTTLIRTALMRNCPGERPPFWEPTLTKDRPDERHPSPPFYNHFFFFYNFSFLIPWMWTPGQGPTPLLVVEGLHCIIFIRQHFGSPLSTSHYLSTRKCPLRLLNVQPTQVFFSFLFCHSPI